MRSTVREDGWLVEVPPDRCPAGHPLLATRRDRQLVAVRLHAWSYRAPDVPLPLPGRRCRVPLNNWTSACSAGGGRLDQHGRFAAIQLGKHSERTRSVGISTRALTEDPDRRRNGLTFG
jgi:hypothetical protein